MQQLYNFACLEDSRIAYSSLTRWNGLTVCKLHSYIEVIRVIFFAVMWHPFEDLILTKASGYVASESAEVTG